MPLAPSRRMPAQLLRRYIRRRSVAWFHDHGSGVLFWNADEQVPRTMLVLGNNNLPIGEGPGRGVVLPSALRLYRVVHPKEAVGRRKWRLARALAEWAAVRWLEPYPDVCADGVLRWHALGRAALAFVEAAIHGGGRSTQPREQEGIASIRSDWESRWSVGVEFLHCAAGKARTAFANRLRWAAEILEDEANTIARGFDAASPDRTGNIPQSFAGELRHDAAAQYLAEAAMIQAGLPASIISSLLEDPVQPLRDRSLHEIIYLARAGVDEFRAVAARRLMGATGSPAAVSTLEQLLYAGNMVVQLTAVTSLLTHGADGMRTLAGFVASQAAHPSEDWDLCSAAALAGVLTHDGHGAAELVSCILERALADAVGMVRTKAVAQAAATGTFLFTPVR
ncbi:MAG: hypothetical protein ACP5VE_03285 [Chthonomonadales bacterium]